MRLRPRQALLVERSLDALRRHGNTLAIAPTGAGKTICSRRSPARCWMSRDEGLHSRPPRRADGTEPRQVRPGQPGDQHLGGRCEGEVLGKGGPPSPWCRRCPAAGISETMPALDLLVIDEAHHAAADSYRRIIDRVRERNPEVPALRRHRHAQPGRRPGAARGVRQCGGSGHGWASSSPPGTWCRRAPSSSMSACRTALREGPQHRDRLRHARGRGIMDRPPITEEVIRHWREKAGDAPDGRLLLDRRPCRARVPRPSSPRGCPPC